MAHVQLLLYTNKLNAITLFEQSSQIGARARTSNMFRHHGGDFKVQNTLKIHITEIIIATTHAQNKYDSSRNGSNNNHASYPQNTLKFKILQKYSLQTRWKLAPKQGESLYKIALKY